MSCHLIYFRTLADLSRKNRVVITLIDKYVKLFCISKNKQRRFRISRLKGDFLLENCCQWKVTHTHTFFFRKRCNLGGVVYIVRNEVCTELFQVVYLCSKSVENFTVNCRRCLTISFVFSCQPIKILGFYILKLCIGFVQIKVIFITSQCEKRNKENRQRLKYQLGMQYKKFTANIQDLYDCRMLNIKTLNI